MKKPAKSKKPRKAEHKWEEHPVPHDESSKYWQWLRSASRRIWNKHPVKLSLKNKRRFKAPIGKDNQLVWAWECEMCGAVTRTIEVDHIKACGSFKSWKEYVKWLECLIYIDISHLRLLCHSCHQHVTYSERYDVSIEEAKIQEQVREIVKDGDKEWLRSKGYEPESNATKRKAQIERILRMEQE